MLLIDIPTAVAARYSRDTTLALSSVLQSGDDVKSNNRPSIVQRGRASVGFMLRRT